MTTALLALFALLALANLALATEELDFCIGGQVSTTVSIPSGLHTCCDVSCETCEWKGEGPSHSCYAAPINAEGQGSLSWRLSTEEKEAGGRLCRHSFDRGCLIEKQLCTEGILSSHAMAGRRFCCPAHCGACDQKEHHCTQQGSEPAYPSSCVPSSSSHAIDSFCCWTTFMHSCTH